MQHCCLASKALSGSGLQRTAHVIKSCRLAECEPGAATEPKRPRWHWEAEFSGEFHRALGESGRIRMLIGQKARRRTVGQRLRQFGGRAEWLQHSQRRVRSIRVPAVTEPVKQHRVSACRHGSPADIPIGVERRDRLLECGRRFAEPGPQAQGFAVVDQQFGAIGVIGPGHGQCLGVVAFGGFHVDAHGPVPGQHQVASRAGGKLPGQRILGSPRQFQGGGVVSGQDLGVVGGPFPRHLLDPGRRTAVTLGALGPRDLRIADIADQRMGEGVFGLARH